MGSLLSTFPVHFAVQTHLESPASTVSPSKLWALLWDTVKKMMVWSEFPVACCQGKLMVKMLLTHFIRQRSIMLMALVVTEMAISVLIHGSHVIGLHPWVRLWLHDHCTTTVRSWYSTHFFATTFNFSWSFQ